MAMLIVNLLSIYLIEGKLRIPGLLPTAIVSALSIASGQAIVMYNKESLTSGGDSI